jgi:hypothetical protein
MMTSSDTLRFQPSERGDPALVAEETHVGHPRMSPVPRGVPFGRD